MKYFYSQYIVMESLIEELHKMDLSDEERYHLASLIDSSLHHVILNEILSNLSKEDKKLFLKLWSEDQGNEKLMEFLQNKVKGIEEKITKVSQDLIDKMHEDIKKAKSK